MILPSGVRIINCFHYQTFSSAFIYPNFNNFSIYWNYHQEYGGLFCFIFPLVTSLSLARSNSPACRLGTVSADGWIRPVINLQQNAYRDHGYINFIFINYEEWQSLFSLPCFNKCQDLKSTITLQWRILKNLRGLEEAGIYKHTALSLSKCAHCPTWLLTE